MAKSSVRKGCLVRSSINFDEYLSVDHIVQPGQTISSSAYMRRIGGKGANGAVALAKAGAHVSFAGLIGEDSGSLKQTIESYGIDADQLITVPEFPTGRAIIQVDRCGDNAIVLVPGANAAPSQLWPVCRIDPILYSYLLLQNEIPLAETCAALTAAQGKVYTVFNPSPLPSQSDIRQTIPWSAVDWLVVNEDEGRALGDAAERRSDTNAQIISESGPEGGLQSSVIEALIQSSFANVGVVLTLGARGCQVGFRASKTDFNWVIFTSPASEGSRPVIDTTGAGDCFTGYLVARLMDIDHGSGKSLTLENVKWAITVAGRAARMCVEKEGTIDSYPSLEEVI